ncbi:MAG: cyanobactin biosynthesis PatC/TenC/TruC family protein [Waterburya sp.]
MAETKGTRKKRNTPATETQPETTAQNLNEAESNPAKELSTLTTGLEDYGRWKEMFKDHKRDPNEKPFRRGRIWS